MYAMDAPQPWSFVFYDVNEITNEAVNGQGATNSNPQWHSELIEDPNARFACPLRSRNRRNRRNRHQPPVYQAKTEVGWPAIAPFRLPLKGWNPDFEVENEAHEQPKTDEPRYVGGRLEPRHILLRPFCDHVLSIPLVERIGCCHKATMASKFHVD